MFQFPSNGKLHSNEKQMEALSDQMVRFNSLQTGNCIQTLEGELSVEKLLSFNSLQTGNCIQTDSREKN